MKSALSSLILAGWLLLAAHTSAQTIPVDYYTYNISPTGSYIDSTGQELTDGVDLTIAWGAGIFITYDDVAPLVGWQGGSYPDITFFFDGPVTIRSFTAWFADSNSNAGVYVPTSITLSTTEGFSETFQVIDPPGDGTTAPFTFGGFEVVTDRITFTAVNPVNWVMLSEVTFSGTALIPEPASATGLLGVFAAAWTLARRRRHKRA